MFQTIRNIYRLGKAGLVLAWTGIPFAPKEAQLPGPLQWRRPGIDEAQRKRLAGAIERLGPSYVKFGQFLATRPDLVGEDLAQALEALRDRLPPFSQRAAQAEIEAAFGKPWNQVFAELSPPVAAASIAQVHKARIVEDGASQFAAVKVLRPAVERRFARDYESFYFAARTAERFSSEARRLRFVAAVDTFARSTDIEMDLRLEAAAMSEMAENIEKAGDTGFRVPKVDWSRTARRVLTTEWIDGIPLTDLDAIERSGLDREALGLNVIRSFLKHAIRDGFFHADMHQGNLFADPKDGAIVAVDFGIMGRIGRRESRFLAEILHGFITRNYRRIAEVHFEAGYVPATQDVEAFAQALRAIGEPIKDRRADEISMGRLLTQLFEVTELFQMQMRPELLLLQKTMVVVEGVARSLDPKLNMWVAAEPVVREWIIREAGPAARLRDAVQDAAHLVQSLRQIPQLVERGSALLNKIGVTPESNAVGAAAGSSAQRAITGVTTMLLWRGFVAICLIIILVKLFWQ